MKLQLVAAALALLICQGNGLGATGGHRAKLDCSSFGNRTSCHTFSQMLAAKDKDFDSLGRSGDDYVCFEKEDTFFHLFLMAVPTGIGDDDIGTASLSEYRNGILYSLRGAKLFRERKGDPLSTNPLWFLGEHEEPFPDKGMALSEGSAEMDLSYGFENMNDQKSNRSISIRLSTLRFVDTIDSPAVRVEKGGQCVAYHATHSERGTRPTVRSQPN